MSEVARQRAGIVAVLAATRIFSQPTIEVRSTGRAVVDGEPAMVQVIITNPGTEAVDLAPPWVWNRVAVEEQGLPLPVRAEVLGQGDWREVPLASWRHDLGSRLEQWRPGLWICPQPTVRLWPGERSVSWIDLAWQYELPPGLYRVSWRGPLFRSAGAERGRFWLDDAYQISAAPEPFMLGVDQAVLVNREAIRWADYVVGSRTPPSRDRCLWIALTDPRELAGSRYARWADYLAVQYDLAAGGRRGDWQMLSPRAAQVARRWLGPDPGTAEHPMKPRIELLCTVMRLLEDAKADPAAWPWLRDQIKAALAASSDHEWVDMLVRLAAWGDVPDFEAARHATPAESRAAREEQQRLAREVPARWGYPWFRLPPDQRPGGAAAKPEP